MQINGELATKEKHINNICNKLEQRAEM